jgi:hypothetical protein
MAKITWQVVNFTQSQLDITEYVRSLNFTFGRPSPLSTYSGNTASLTITNDNDQVSLANIQDRIYFYASVSGPLVPVFIGEIASRNFQDEPGSGNNSTATILINDTLLQAGMANIENYVLGSPNDQIAELQFALNNQFIIDSVYFTDIEMGTGTFSVNVGQRLNEIFAADQGVISNFEGSTVYNPPSRFQEGLNDSATPSFGRTTSSTQIGYQSLSRIEANSNSLFYTQATVTGSATTVTATNTTAVATYGTRTFTATTAQSNKVSERAQWFSNVYSDPEMKVFQIGFTDVAQNATALDDFLNFMLANTKFAYLSYTPPGGVSTTSYYWPEQITVNATIDQTTVDMVMTPATYYANFVLDSDFFGFLDVDRLGF